MPTTTVKLVVIGASGVGKTSLRGQYISGRFSTGYRATIGTDFITKNIPHPTLPDESVSLQIWDTAGQERFSSLSSAFFRGADAVLLMFDVNEPDTLEALKKWWMEFKENAPLGDEEAEDYCCVVVGNKLDMVSEGQPAVSEQEALRFLDELVPPSSPRVEFEEEEAGDPMSASQLTARIPYIGMPMQTPSLADLRPCPDSPSTPIALSIPPSYSHLRSYSSPGPTRKRMKSRSRSSSRFQQGTMTTAHTTLTIYHTPSSSLFDVYQSARASPEPSSYYTSYHSRSSSSSPTHAPRRMPSNSSTSSGSILTLTPSSFARVQNSTAVTTPPTPTPDASGPFIPERRPKLFFTSAKTGEGVSDVFEYITQRVVRRWAYVEDLEARCMHMLDGSTSETVRLGLDGARAWSRERRQASCCST